MTNEQWIAVYVAALILFPFIVQFLTIPLLFLADLIDSIVERWKRRTGKTESENQT